MTTHITLTTFVVFFVLAAVGAIMFALARFASHGAFSPGVSNDASPEENAEDDATDEGTAPVQHLMRGSHDQTPLDL